MRKSLLFGASLVLAGCAQQKGSAPTSGSAPSSIYVSQTGSSAGYRLESTAETATSYPKLVEGAPDRVWSALPDVYQELEIPVLAMDTEARILGNRSFIVSRRLGGQRMSTYLDCGKDAIGAPAADVYQIQLDIVTELQSVSETRTQVLTQMNAHATPRATSGSPARCKSTGKLEERIASMLAGRIG